MQMEFGDRRGTKRPREPGNFDENEFSVQDLDVEEGGEVDLDEILKLVEDAPEVKEMDEVQVQQMTIKLQRCVDENLELRTKFPNEPRKFLDSEVALDETIQALQSLSSASELYPYFVKQGAVDVLVGLLSHDNSDIAISVINVINELLGEETMAEDEEALALINALMAKDFVTMLVSNISRFDENNREDAQCIYNIMSVVENLLEFKPEVGALLFEPANHGLLLFCFERIKREGMDATKLYASETIGVLLQQASLTGKELVGKKIGSSDPGLVTMLKCLNKFRKRDPEGEEEKEFVENLFNAVCVSLTDCHANKTLFAKVEGMQLMISIIRKKRYATAGAIKTLDYVLQDHVANCELFVDIKGLKTAFSLFVARQKSKDKKSGVGRQREEHIVSILAQLFLNLSETRYLRLLRKFQENNMQKIDRLLELQESYAEMVAVGEKAAEAARAAAAAAGPGAAEELAQLRYLDKLEAGLFTLQLLSLVIGFVFTAGVPELKARVTQVLDQRDDSIEDIKAVMLEQLKYMEAGEADKEGEQEGKPKKEADKEAEQGPTAFTKLRAVLAGVVNMLE